MKVVRILAAVVVMCSLSASGTDVLFAQGKKAKGPKTAKLDELKWEQVPDAPEGLMMAVVWGNPEKGGYGIYTKFPPDTKFPLHYHSNESKVIVISGSISAIGEDGKRIDGGRGDYAEVSAKWRHTTEVGPEGAILFEWSTKKADIVMVEEKATSKK